MSDLISRSALLKSIGEVSTSPLNEWDTMGVLNIVSQQPTVEFVPDTNVGDKWIPCSERLPEVGRKILLQTQGKQMTVAFLGKKHMWYSDSGDGFCTSLCVKPIAWTPLPQPYKGESHGKFN